MRDFGLVRGSSFAVSFAPLSKNHQPATAARIIGFGYTPGTLMARQNSHAKSVDLFAIAHQSMLDAGFYPDFGGAVKSEVNSLEGKPAEFSADSGRDLRALLWSSIDDSKSRDLDQVEYAEPLSNGDTRLMVGIADVDALVPKGSATDEHAGENCTSVYAGVKTFPMLP